MRVAAVASWTACCLAMLELLELGTKLLEFSALFCNSSSLGIKLSTLNLLLEFGSLFCNSNSLVAELDTLNFHCR